MYPWCLEKKETQNITLDMAGSSNPRITLLLQEKSTAMSEQAMEIVLQVCTIHNSNLCFVLYYTILMCMSLYVYYNLYMFIMFICP